MCLAVPGKILSIEGGDPLLRSEAIVLAEFQLLTQGPGPFYFFLLFIHFIYTYPIARWSISLERKFAVKI